jgi:hypothetical protein
MKHDTKPFANRLIRGAALSLAFLSSATALAAQEGGWSKSNYGLQLGYMLPMGDLAEEQNPGFGAAAFYEKVFSSGFAARARLEYTSFGKMEFSTLFGNSSVQMTQIGAMLDLIWYKDLKDTIYPFAGLGYFNRTLYFEGFVGGGSTSADLDSEIAFCAGLGLNFSRHFGMEAKYTVCEYNWAQLSLLYRF